MPEKFLANHPKWRGEFILNDDGTFVGGNGRRGGGTWKKEGNNLLIEWYHWDKQTLVEDNRGYTSNKLKLIRLEEFVSISFCTTCMGRLKHLKETLPHNIEVASKYRNIEFVLLDYNSKDGLEEWVRENMMDHIESGILTYYKNREPLFFDMSHAKNMSHRLGTKDVLCNLDADNKLSDDFIKQVRYEFSNNIDSVLKPNSNLKGNAGRISVSRDNFHYIRGYDESAVGWGNEDQDFFNKCDIKGMNVVKVEDAYSIPHTDEERAENYQTKKIRFTSRMNANTLRTSMLEGFYLSNMEDSYGDGTVVKNFKEEIKLESIPCTSKPSTIRYTFDLNDGGQSCKIYFLEGPNYVLKEMTSRHIDRVTSYWFEKGTWKEEPNYIVVEWFHRDIEIFNKVDSNNYVSKDRTLGNRTLG